MQRYFLRQQTFHYSILFIDALLDTGLFSVYKILSIFGMYLFISFNEISQSCCIHVINRGYLVVSVLLSDILAQEIGLKSSGVDINSSTS